jgi:hypothetical protein
MVGMLIGGIVGMLIGGMVGTLIGGTVTVGEMLAQPVASMSVAALATSNLLNVGIDPPLVRGVIAPSPLPSGREAA